MTQEFYGQYWVSGDLRKKKLLDVQFQKIHHLCTLLDMIIEDGIQF